MITERQYRLLMKEYRTRGVISTAALKANMDRETGTKYIEQGHGPQPQKARGRRRHDPLATIWAEAERILGETPELEGKLLFEHLLEKHGCAAEAQRALRTFQRRMAQWRRYHGAPMEVFSPQTREPASSLQLDWTHGKTLKPEKEVSNGLSCEGKTRGFGHMIEQHDELSDDRGSGYFLRFPLASRRA
jgi:hypothetical protein